MITMSQNKYKQLSEPTGNVRVRRGFFGGLVLQVETYDGWRDAQTQDLSVLRISAFRIVKGARHPVLVAADRVDYEQQYAYTEA